MKITIQIDGVLFIEAENPLEGYALNKWAEDYMKKCKCDRILIDTIAYKRNKK